MIVRRAGVTFAVLVIGPLLVIGGCSSSSDTSDVTGPAPGADGSVLPADGGGSDGASDSASPTPGTCEGDCKMTALTTDFGGKKRVLERAQFGTEPGDAGTQLHTESHLGGSAACPSQSSPTPDYTLIVSGIPRGAAGRKLSDRDGVTSAFFDFKGDLGLPPLTKGVSVNVAVVAEDPATPPTWVALDVSTGFREGTVKGHLYAEFCQSLSE